ncbi:MAG: hypothetical protein M5U28_52160 [Sandaracinaceae bacterium]|nr:hypothetical protein [Sandaracinaceae bacterium]
MRTLVRRALASLAALTVLAHGAGARAQALPPSADVTLTECEDPSFDVDAMLAILRLELANDGVTELRIVREAAPAEAVALIALADCGAAAVRITIDDNATGKRISRPIELGSVPAASRARVLALGIAELLRASWAELAIAEVPALPPVIRERVLRRLAAHGAALDPPRSEDELRAPAAQASREPLALAVLGEVRAFASGASPCSVGSCGSRSQSSKRSCSGSSLHAGWGRAFHPWGAIELATVGGSLEPRVRASFGRLRVDVAAVLDVAWARVEGRAHTTGVRPSGGDAPLVALGLAAELSYALAGSLRAHVGLGAGAAVAGVQATVEDAPVAGASGAYLGLQLGLGYGF